MNAASAEVGQRKTGFFKSFEEYLYCSVGLNNYYPGPCSHPATAEAPSVRCISPASRNGSLTHTRVSVSCAI